MSCSVGLALPGSGFTLGDSDGLDAPGVGFWEVEDTGLSVGADVGARGVGVASLVE